MSTEIDRYFINSAGVSQTFPVLSSTCKSEQLFSNLWCGKLQGNHYSDLKYLTVQLNDFHFTNILLYESIF